MCSPYTKFLGFSCFQMITVILQTENAWQQGNTSKRMLVDTQECWIHMSSELQSVPEFLHVPIRSFLVIFRHTENSFPLAWNETCSLQLCLPSSTPSQTGRKYLQPQRSWLRTTSSFTALLTLKKKGGGGGRHYFLLMTNNYN